MRDTRSLRLFLVSGGVLITLVLLCYRMAYYPVHASDVVGAYHRAPVMFLKVDSLPDRVVLEENGIMKLYSAEGSPTFEGIWRWDEKERMIRVDHPRWDRRIRVRSTLTGPRLSMKVSDLPLEIDHHEHDEEVDLTREDRTAISK